MENEIMKLILNKLQDGVGINLNSYIILGVVVLLASYLGSYFKRKGENLATKEDINEITHKVESIKTAMGSKLYIHQVRYEKEFEILSMISEKLIKLRDVAKSLRPLAEYKDSKMTDEEIKIIKINNYHKAALDFYNVIEKSRPFYPNELYDAFRKLDDATWKELVEYKNSNLDKFGLGDFKVYWDKAESNSKTITGLSEIAIIAIKDRVKEWETLNFKKNDNRVD